MGMIILLMYMAIIAIKVAVKILMNKNIDCLAMIPHSNIEKLKNEFLYLT